MSSFKMCNNFGYYSTEFQLKGNDTATFFRLFAWLSFWVFSWWINIGSMLVLFLQSHRYVDSISDYLQWWFFGVIFRGVPRKVVGNHLTTLLTFLTCFFKEQEQRLTFLFAQIKFSKLQIWRKFFFTSN